MYQAKNGMPSSYFNSSLCPPEGNSYMLESQLHAKTRMLNRVQNDPVGVWHTLTHFTSISNAKDVQVTSHKEKILTSVHRIC